MSARSRDRLSLSLLPLLDLLHAALFPLDVSTIRRIARYCALSMPGPLLHPTTRVGTSLRHGLPAAELSPPVTHPSRACDRREHVTSSTFSYAAIAPRSWIMTL